MRFLQQVLLNGVVLAVNYALIALGITLIFSIMNILNFAHGQMFMIGGFVVYYLYGLFGMNYFVSLIAVVVVLGAIGWCFETFFFRRMRKIATREENSMLLAVGTALLLENLALSSFGEKQRGVSSRRQRRIYLRLGTRFCRPVACWSWFLLSRFAEALRRTAETGLIFRLAAEPGTF
jgi:branched-subunit amino acid ABC-type transport system permease component